MQIWIIRAIFMILSAAFGYGIDGIYGGAVALIVAIIAIGLESSVPRPLLRDFFVCLVGLTFGLIIAGIVIYIMSQTTTVNPMVTMGTVLVMSYAGMMIIYRRRKNPWTFFSIRARRSPPLHQATKSWIPVLLLTAEFLRFAKPDFSRASL